MHNERPASLRRYSMTMQFTGVEMLASAKDEIRQIILFWICMNIGISNCEDVFDEYVDASSPQF